MRTADDPPRPSGEGLGGTSPRSRSGLTAARRLPLGFAAGGALHKLSKTRRTSRRATDNDKAEHIRRRRKPEENHAAPRRPPPPTEPAVGLESSRSSVNRWHKPRHYSRNRFEKTSWRTRSEAAGSSSHGTKKTKQNMKHLPPHPPLQPHCPPRAQPLIWFFRDWRLFLVWASPPPAPPTAPPGPCSAE